MRRVLIVLCFSLAVWPLPGRPSSARADTNIHERRVGQWSGGAGVGFLGNTPDGVLEFAFNGHADYFVHERLSIGPLAQYAGAGNDFLFGLSAQARYWWDIPGIASTRIVVQGGIGFVRAGIKDTDSGTANTFSSFLIPGRARRASSWPGESEMSMSIVVSRQPKRTAVAPPVK